MVVAGSRVLIFRLRTNLTTTPEVFCFCFNEDVHYKNKFQTQRGLWSRKKNGNVGVVVSESSNTDKAVGAIMIIIIIMTVIRIIRF